MKNYEEIQLFRGTADGELHQKRFMLDWGKRRVIVFSNEDGRISEEILEPFTQSRVKPFYEDLVELHFSMGWDYDRDVARDLFPKISWNAPPFFYRWAVPKKNPYSVPRDLQFFELVDGKWVLVMLTRFDAIGWEYNTEDRVKLDWRLVEDLFREFPSGTIVRGVLNNRRLFVLDVLFKNKKDNAVMVPFEKRQFQKRRQYLRSFKKISTLDQPFLAVKPDAFGGIVYNAGQEPQARDFWIFTRKSKLLRALR